MSDKKSNELLNENTDEELLSDQDLSRVSGGEDSSHDRSLYSGVSQDSTNANSNTLELDPTFPVPPHPEDLL